MRRKKVKMKTGTKTGIFDKNGYEICLGDEFEGGGKVIYDSGAFWIEDEDGNLTMLKDYYIFGYENIN